MARKKHFILDIDSIPSVIEEYFNANTQFEYEISKLDDKGLLLKIKKGKSQGILNLFYVKGQVSFSVQGRMQEKAEDCWNYIKQKTSLPNKEHKTYTIRDVSEDDFINYKKWAQVRKSVDGPPGMLTEDHHHTVHEERQVCYSSHLRPKSLHL